MFNNMRATKKRKTGERQPHLLLKLSAMVVAPRGGKTTKQDLGVAVAGKVTGCAGTAEAVLEP